MLQEKQRLFEEHIADLIADSFFENMYDWTHTPDLNCYAFARGLTYPDSKHQFYAPGKIYQMKFGYGNVLQNECNPRFIDKCIENDSIALKQNCQRVSFSDIKEDDVNFYFAITKFHLPSLPNEYHWHFICRTPSGLWLHKPNWFSNVQFINWIEYGKSFFFSATPLEVDKMLVHPSSDWVQYEGFCFENYFYKLELAED